MAADLAHVDCDELWRKIQAGEPLVLVDARSPLSYAASHLPGAINLPELQVGELAPRRIADLDTEVVVYCSGSPCKASTTVARHLLELGYRNVCHFADGTNGWTEASLPLEGGRVGGR